jgi:hypothetical protein
MWSKHGLELDQVKELVSPYFGEECAVKSGFHLKFHVSS